MTRQELALEFINRIKNHNYEEFYKFFTKETSVYLITEHKEIKIEEMISLLQEKIKDDLRMGRVLESKVCTKIETFENEEQINFFFDVKNRRIIRLEIEII